MRSIACKAATALLGAVVLAAGATAEVVPALGFDPADTNVAIQTYIAPFDPINYRLRLPDGTIREFEFTGDGYSGARGWRFSRKKDVIRLVPGKADQGAFAPMELDFRNGRLRSISCAGRKYEYPLADGVRCEAPVESLWPELQERMTISKEDQARLDTWKKRRGKRARLREASLFGWRLHYFHNPNRAAAFFAALALMGVALVLRVRWWSIVSGAGLWLPSFWCLMMTRSRSGLLAFLVGTAMLFAFRFLRLTKVVRIVLCAAAVLVLAAGLFLSHDARITKNLVNVRDRSNATRFNIYRAAPRMIAAAPWGWNYDSPGHAYAEWFQPSTDFFISRSMVNDHLDFLVEHGIPMRFLWIFGWLALLGMAFVEARSGKSSLPLALWLVQGMMGWFNTVFGDPWVWVGSVAALVVFLSGKPWLRLRRHGIALGAAAVLAGLALAATYGLAAADGTRPSVHTDGRRVWIGSAGREPVRWVVSDNFTLGFFVTGKEIRRFYQANPQSPAIGFVRSVRDLPLDARRVMLAGTSGWEYLENYKLLSGRKGFRPPEALMFLSPPFGVSRIPNEIFERSQVAIVIGEFATRFMPEYAKAQPGVVVIPGCEIYLPIWLQALTTF